MSFQTPYSSVVVETTIKKSRFICWLGPVAEKAAFVHQLNLIRKQYPDASHHCSAMIIGNPANPAAMQFNDDGEPSGSAGRPMLEMLLKQNVGNVGAVVTRYFGGVKLGLGGLMRAYRRAVGAALQQVELEKFTPLGSLQVACDFSQESRLRFLAKQSGARFDSVTYGEQVCARLTLTDRKSVV